MSPVNLLLGFIRRHGGIEAKLKLEDMLNNEGITHKEIAAEFKIDEGQLSHLIHKCFRRKYVTDPPIQEALDIIEQSKRETYEKQRRASARILRFGGE